MISNLMEIFALSITGYIVLGVALNSFIRATLWMINALKGTDFVN